MQDSESGVDIGINDVPPGLRNRFREAAGSEGLTYEEMLDKLLHFRDKHEGGFRRFDPEKRDRGGPQFRQPKD